MYYHMHQQHEAYFLLYMASCSLFIYLLCYFNIFCDFERLSDFYERLINPRWRLFNWTTWRNPVLHPGRKRSQKNPGLNSIKLLFSTLK